MLLDASPERLEDFWGTDNVAYAIELGAGHGLAEMVNILLSAEGEDRQQYWAKARSTNIPAILRAAACGSAPTIGVLLAAGADEQTLGNDGRCASEYAGIMLPVDNTTTDGKISAVRRTLERAPAYRARSWAWSISEISPQGAGAAGGASAASATRRESAPTPAGVRIFRPKGQRLFTTRFDR